MCKFPSFFSNHFLSPQVLTWKEVGEIDILSNCAGKRYYRICYKGTFLRHCEAQVTDKAIFGHYHLFLWSLLLRWSPALRLSSHRRLTHDELSANHLLFCCFKGR